jgi:AcrR family transcriptional regulator
VKLSVGRPRDASIDGRVIEAALDLIQDAGLVGLSVDGIAARAGVSKATIYRRWDSKDELVVDAIASLAETAGFQDSGDVRVDLVTAVSELREFVCDTRAGEVFPWLAGEISGRTPLGARYATAVMVPKRALIADILARAVERGELRSDLDVGIAVDVVIGPVIVKRLSGEFEDTPVSWVEDLVDTILSGWSS